MVGLAWDKRWEVYSLLPSNWRQYDCSDSFPFDYEPIGIQFGSYNQTETRHIDHKGFGIFNGHPGIMYTLSLKTLLV